MEDEFSTNSAALDNASDMAGEFLAERGSSDLASLDGLQWREFLKVIIKGYQTKRVSL